jgi:transposase
MASASKKTAHAAEQDRPDVKAARATWRDNQRSLDPDQLVFVDETGVSTNMDRLRGRAPLGERLIGKIPHGHWNITTFVAGLRRDGIIAPLVTDGAMNGAIFRAWIEQSLTNKLRTGDIVIMDNLAVHKVAGVRRAIEDAGARLIYLPPYSPDLNPIEMMFSKLKSLLRKAKERTMRAVWDRIGTSLSEFLPAECANYLAHQGYGST